MVCTRCMTYNHASYIEDALKGFCLQETSFPVVYIVVDDASKDGEPDVLRKWASENLVCNKDLLWKKTLYGEIAEAPLIGNSLVSFVILLLSENHYQTGRGQQRLDYIKEWMNNSRYIALCEGDDYWIDSMKLQKQCDFLNSHLDYSLCFHNTKLLYEIDKGSFPIGVKCDGQVSADDVFLRWTVPTASIVYRNGADQLKTQGDHRILHGDIIFILKCAESGKLWGMKDEMAVYRLHSDSAIHNKKNVERNRERVPEHTKFILDNFHCVSRSVVRKKLGMNYYECFCHTSHFSLKSIKYLFCSLYYNPHYFFKNFAKSRWNLFKR